MPDIKQMFLDGREKGYERNRKNQREKDWRKGRKEAQVQVESIKILGKIKQTEKSEKKQKNLKEKNFLELNICLLRLLNTTAGFPEKHCL